MKKTSDGTKRTFIDNVLRLLENKEKKHEVRLVIKQSDLTKQYKKSQCIVRENKELFNGIDLYKRINSKVLEDTSDLLDKDAISITNENIIDEIEILENEQNTKVTDNVNSTNNCMNMIRKAFEMGIFKISKSFLSDNNIETKLFGYNENNEAFYYCNEIEGYFEII